MRPVLRLLGSRYGLAALLILLVLAVVAVTRAVFPSPAHVVGAALPGGSASVNPTAGNDGVAGSAAATGASATGAVPTPTATRSGPDPVPVATAFLRAWLHHTGVTQKAWYAGIAPYMTAALAGKLTATDPADVPASRMTGPATVTALDPTYAEVSVPVDAGTIVLRLKLSAAGRWQVDGVDWNRP